MKVYFPLGPDVGVEGQGVLKQDAVLSALLPAASVDEGGGGGVFASRVAFQANPVERLKICQKKNLRRNKLVSNLCSNALSPHRAQSLLLPAILSSSGLLKKAKVKTQFQKNQKGKMYFTWDLSLVPDFSSPLGLLLRPPPLHPPPRSPTKEAPRPLFGGSSDRRPRQSCAHLKISQFAHKNGDFKKVHAHPLPSRCPRLLPPPIPTA